MGLLINISRLLSALLHPFFQPTIALLVLLTLNTHVSFTLSVKSKLFLLIVVFINTAALPILFVLFLKKMGLIGSISMKERKDRIVPLIMGTVVHIANYFLLLKMELHPLITFFFAGVTLVVLAALIATLWWKISLHMLAAGAISGFFYNFGIIAPVSILHLIALTFLVSGLLGTARLTLGTSQARQVFAGFLVGFGVMVLLFLYSSS